MCFESVKATYRFWGGIPFLGNQPHGASCCVDRHQSSLVKSCKGKGAELLLGHHFTTPGEPQALNKIRRCAPLPLQARTETRKPSTLNPSPTVEDRILVGFLRPSRRESPKSFHPQNRKESVPRKDGEYLGSQLRQGFPAIMFLSSA